MDGVRGKLTPAQRGQIEAEWERLKTDGDARSIKSYIERHPDAALAPLADDMFKGLTEKFVNAYHAVRQEEVTAFQLRRHHPRPEDRKAHEQAGDAVIDAHEATAMYVRECYEKLPKLPTADGKDEAKGFLGQVIRDSIIAFEKATHTDVSVSPTTLAGVAR